MEFKGVRFMPPDMLGLSQIYLNIEKIAGIEKWFDPKCMDNFEPLSVRDFGNGVYTLTDGHTRAYVAYKNGVQVPVIYDNDDIVTCETGMLLYTADIEWCERFGLKNVSCLENRILSGEMYKKLWHQRCDRSHDLLMQTSTEERARMQSEVPHLFLYGASEDLTVLYFESRSGELYSYKNRTLTRE